MAITDEAVKLVLDLVKSAGSDATIAALEKLRAATMAASQGYEVLERQVGAYELVEKEAEQVVGRQTSAFTKLALGIGGASAETRAFTGSMNTLKGTEGRGGTGVLAASYAVQDFTSQLGTTGMLGGLRAVQNNIPGILIGLGAGAGLAGILSGLAVAAGLVADNWGKIKNAFTSDDVKKKTEEMDKFAEAIKRSADAGERAAEALKKVLSPDQRKPGEAIKRAADAFGGDAVLTELTRGLVVSGRANVRGGDAQRRAGELIAGVQGGDERAQKLMADILAKTGRGDIANVLMGGKTPAEQAKDRADQAKKAADENDAAEKKRQDAKKKNDENVDDLNRRGQEYQRLGEQEKAAQDKKDVKDRIGAQAREMKAQEDLAKRRQRESTEQFKALPGPNKESLQRGDDALRMKYIANLVHQSQAKMGGTEEENAQLLINQGAITGNMRVIAEKMMRSLQIQRQQQQIGNVLAGQQ